MSRKSGTRLLSAATAATDGSRAEVDDRPRGNGHRPALDAAPDALARARVEIALLRTRVDQLQTALDSRVLIEQAKGILAVLLDRPVEEAFELLRRAARSHRMRIHTLAAEVVNTRAVPPKISCLLYGDRVRRSVA